MKINLSNLDLVMLKNQLDEDDILINLEQWSSNGDISLEVASVEDSKYYITRYDHKEHKSFISQMRDMEDYLVESSKNQIKPLSYDSGEIYSLTDDEYMSDFMGEGKELWIATDDKNLIGTVLIRTDAGYKDTISISLLMVAEAYRNKGYGSKILDFIKSTYKKKYKYMILSVTSKNPALRLYERKGFKEYQKNMFAKL